MTKHVRVSHHLKRGVGLAMVAVLLGGASASIAGDARGRDENGAIRKRHSQPGFAAHFFRQTTVASYNSVSNGARRCNGVLDEPGVGRYVYVVAQATNDSELTCMYIDVAVANDRTVFGFINADQTVNFIEVE